MPIVHDPKTGKFSSSGGSGATGGGKTHAALTAELKAARERAFVAKPGASKARAERNVSAAQSKVEAHAALTKRVKMLHQKVFVAPQGSKVRRSLEKQLEQATAQFEGTR